MAILQGARITGSIIATTFIKASGFSGSLTASNLYVLGKAGIGTTSPGAKLDVNGDVYVSPNTAGKNTFILSTNASNDARLLMKSDTTTKVDIQANGTSYFNGGNVGIGTTAPFGTAANRTVLSVNGTTDVSLNIGSGGSQRAYLYGVSSYAELGTIGSLPLRFAPNNSEKMRLDANGNLGIGTTSPNAALDVNGSIHLNGNIRNVWGDNLFNVTQYPSNSSTSPDYYMGFQTEASTRIFYINNRNNDGSATDPNGGIIFRTGGTPTNRMLISYTGNVGIGTTSPSGSFHIYNSTSYNAILETTTANNVQLRFRKSGTDKWSIYVGNSSNDLTLWDGASDRVTFQNGGNVGIGTTSPTNKLHISGSSTNLPLKLEGLTSNATGYFLTVDNTTGVVHKSTSGASGTSGTSGANGSPGTSGTSGANGSPGTSGTSGANGSPGTSGSSGSGSSGISGSSGTSGTTNIKAWVHFDGTGTPTINASLNVSSITDNNTGDYTINFTTAFANANYVVAGTATYEYENPGQSINNMFIAVPRRPNAQLAGSCRISTPGSDNALYDCKYVRVLFSN